MILKRLPSFQLSAHAKHLLHCSVLVCLILLFSAKLAFGSDLEPFDPFIRYGTIAASCFYVFRFLALLALPQCIFNFLGLTMYNAFVDKVKVNGSPLLAPFISFRVVTRGDYPNLVKKNVDRNMETCLKVGLDNFLIEVVTDKPLNLSKHPRLREVVVPSTYSTRTGALFKVIHSSLIVNANTPTSFLFCSRQERCNFVWKSRTIFLVKMITLFILMRKLFLPRIQSKVSSILRSVVNMSLVKA